MLKYPSATFLALTLAITYGIGLPIAAASHGLLRVDIPATLGGLALYVAIWGPALAAVVLSGLHSGRTGLRQLLGQLVNWRVGILWYLVALLTPAAIAVAALGLHAIVGGPLPRFPGPLPQEFSQAGMPSVTIYLLLPVFFILGSMGEEIGWRGYALPHLQVMNSALTASLLVGVVWAAWHLPLFLTSGTTFSQIPFGWFMLSILGMSVLLTWLYNNTNGSLLIATLFHAALQATNVFLLSVATMDQRLYALSVFITVVAALLVVLLFGPVSLSRRHGRSTVVEL
jgi:membrane protease YdiL (CAAX protease family)